MSTFLTIKEESIDIERIDSGDYENIIDCFLHGTEVNIDDYLADQGVVVIYVDPTRSDQWKNYKKILAGEESDSDLEDSIAICLTKRQAKVMGQYLLTLSEDMPDLSKTQE